MPKAKHLLALLLVAAPLWSQNPVTPKFPASVAGDSDLFVASNQPLTPVHLVGDITNSATSLVVSSSTGLLAPARLTIDQEVIKCSTLAGTTFSGCVRHAENTSAAPHTGTGPTPAVVNFFLTAEWMNEVAAEIKATQGSLAARSLNCAAGGGTAQAQAVTLVPALPSYANGSLICWIPSVANTAADPTINVNGLGVKTVVKTGPNSHLLAGDIQSGAVAYGIYVSGTDVVILLNPATGSQNHVFVQTTAPGTIVGNLPGDLVSDSTNHNLYWCNAPSGTAAPACTSVTAGGWTLVNGGGGVGGGGVNAQTVNYTLVSGDAGKLVTMNGASITATLPASPPSATWWVQIQNLNASALTIARNGLTINGGTSNLTLQQYQWTIVYTDGTNYFAKPPIAAGANITVTMSPSAETLIGVSATGCTPGGASGDFEKNNGSGGCNAGNLNQNSDGSVNASKAITVPAPYSPMFNSGGATTCDWSQSNVCKVVFSGGNTTLAVSNPHGSGPYTLISVQDTSCRTYTFPGTFKGASQPDCGSGVVTTQDFTYDGSNYQGKIAATPSSTWHGMSAPPAAFSNFPTCSSTYDGTLGTVTDSTTQAFGATVTGSGSLHVAMYCNGTNWIAVSGIVSSANGGAFPTSAHLAGTNGSAQPIASTVHDVALVLACLDSSGSGTAQSCSTTPSFTPAAGDTIVYNTTTTNTGDLTINVNSSSAVHVRKWQASAVLASGDLVAGVYILLTYDGTYWEAYSIGNAPSGGGSGGGVNAKTANYTLVSGDAGKLVTMNGSSLTATLYATPSSTYAVGIKNLNASPLTISRNGLQINGGTSNLTLQQYQAVACFSDGTNYFCDVPNVAGSGITLTQGVSGQTIALNLTPSLLPNVNVLTSTSGAVADPGSSMDYQFNNASGALTFNVPAGVAGLQRCYRNATGKSGVITLQMATSNTVDYNGSNGSSAGTLVSGGALGDAICLVSDAANHWYAYAQHGTWANN